MSGILRALSASVQNDDPDDDPQIVNEPTYTDVHEPDLADISGAPKQKQPEYTPSEYYLEGMAGIAVLTVIPIISHLMHYFVSIGIRATEASLLLLIPVGFGLCLLVPKKLRKSVKSKQHGRRKMGIAIALTAVIWFISLLLSA